MISRKNIEKEILKIEDKLINIRRYLHKNPEIGFEIDNTFNFVFGELIKIGLEPIKCGKSGIYCDIGKGSEIIILRADMDGLKIKENNNLSFKSKNGNMHACGHDLHTSMLIGSAIVLKKFENELKNKVRLVFQPAEEILLGAKDMIDNGILEGNIKYALMIHNLPNLDIDVGSFYIAKSGVVAPSVYNFKIDILGKGGHGAMPELCYNPINVSLYLIKAIEDIFLKEISFSEKGIISFCEIESGNSFNVIPNKCVIKGSYRLFNDNSFIEKRIKEVCSNISKAFKCKVNIDINNICPSLVINNDLYLQTKSVFEKEFKDNLIVDDFFNGNGSEDFAYFSKKVPSIMINVVSGNKSKGYKYNLHNEKVIFDESCIAVGSLIYSYFALNI